VLLSQRQERRQSGFGSCPRSSGNIYGTTELGGSKNQGEGTVFELSPLGDFNYKHTVIWTFNGTDGEYPLGSLILNSAGNLYGTTNSGGSSKAGVVFEITGVRVSTATTLSSSSDPSTYGQAVTFTAAITCSRGTPPDGETISFMKGKTVLGLDR